MDVNGAKNRSQHHPLIYPRQVLHLSLDTVIYLDSDMN